ncbi:MAG TPA: 4Fe-4S binding protein [Stellaceae bacterium]|nr:4Fe-4S binding protein [Stellaceae bacterium]
MTALRFALRHTVLVLAAMLMLAAGASTSPALALGEEPKAGENLAQYLTPAIRAALFPDADAIGAIEGTPPAAPVLKQGRLLGYIFSTWDVTQSKGFSNRPLVLLVGLDLTGHITAVKLVHHSEPIAILGLQDEEFFRFTEKYAGHDINNGVDVVIRLSSSVLGDRSFSQRSAPNTTDTDAVDAVSRATTSSVLMSDAIIRGARIVARSRGLLRPTETAARLDIDRFEPAAWPALEAAGAVAHLKVPYGDLQAAMREKGITALPGADRAAAPDTPFLDLYAALVTPAGIGVNVLGDTWYSQYTAGRGLGDQLILIAAKSPVSILDADWEQAEHLSRLEIVQGEKTIKLSGKQIKTLPFLHAKSAPDLTERVFVFLRRADIDPTRAWQVRLLLDGKTGAGQPGFITWSLPYQVPTVYITSPAPVTEAGAGGDDHALAWREIWRGHGVKIGILAAGLIALTAILTLQGRLSRHRVLHRWLRIGFLTWTLIWLGWYAGAQLTVLNLITDIHTLVTDFRWDHLLADPLIALLSVFTLAGIFFWGRAVYCGWLCPYGALQELANKLAQRLRVPQLTLPAKLQERIVWVKYLLFVGLVAVSFVSWDLANTGAEIEPFKAAIILRFVTEWPMVLYALVLTGASLFIERFYCRFGCPLGGGLAILGRVRLFDFLKRRPECGSRCHLCEGVCPVGAIRPSGKIDMNECFYCLDCQVTYYDEHLCPPLVWARKREPVAAAGGSRTGFRRTGDQP